MNQQVVKKIQNKQFLSINKITLLNTTNIFKTQSTIMANNKIFNLAFNVDYSTQILRTNNKNFNINNTENSIFLNNKQTTKNNMSFYNNENEFIKFNELPFEQFYDIGEQLGRFNFIYNKNY